VNASGAASWQQLLSLWELLRSLRPVVKWIMWWLYVRLYVRSGFLGGAASRNFRSVANRGGGLDCRGAVSSIYHGFSPRGAIMCITHRTAPRVAAGVGCRVWPNHDLWPNKYYNAIIVDCRPSRLRATALSCEGHSRTNDWLSSWQRAKRCCWRCTKSTPSRRFPLRATQRPSAS
jgi:hypothetical protein